VVQDDLFFSNGRLGILNSDAVNRYGERFTIGALLQAFEGTNRLGLPTTLAHDAHRPIGWTVPLCIYLSREIASLVGQTYLAQDKNAAIELEGLYRQYLTYKDQEQFKPYLEEFRAALGPDKFDDGFRLYLECAAILKSDIAVAQFPSIFSQADDDGLIDLASLSDFKYLGAGVFQCGRFCIFADRKFRRSLSLANNTNFFFLDYFVALSDSGVKKRIAIDRDLIGYAPSFKVPIELEYWWGPKYNDDLSHISAGVTRHSSSERDRLYSQIEFTDFWWQSRKGEHIFEAEEIRASRTFSDLKADDAQKETFGCRYVHSIVNESTGLIEHLDGAIRTYTEEEMLARLDQALPEVGRKLKYKKLWRIDGKIKITQWKSLVHHFYLNNSLVGEYLGIEKSSDTERELPIELLGTSDALAAVVPYSISDATGIITGVTFDDRRSTLLDVDVKSYDTYKKPGSPAVYWVRNSTIEIVKLLRKQGLAVHFDDSLWVLKFKDRYIDLPVFELKDQAQVSVVLGSLRLYVSCLVSNSADTVVNFSLKYPLDAEVDVTISVVATEKNMQAFLDHACSGAMSLPTSLSTVEPFLDGVKRLNAKSPGPCPDVFGVCMKTGLVKCLRRRLGDEFDISFYTDKETGVLMFNMKIPKDKPHFLAAMKTKGLYPILALRIDSYDCDLCGGNYLLCGCTKALDSAKTRISKSTPIGTYWSDRPDV